MRLKGKHKARCKRYDKRETGGKRKDALTADMHFAIVSTRNQATKLYGSEFALLAFATTLEEGDDVRHLAAMIKPSQDFKPEKHAIEIDGTEVVAKPIIGKIYPVEDAAKVRVEIKIPVYVACEDGLGAALEAKSGQDVEIAFAETQRPLPFEDEDEGEEE